VKTRKPLPHLSTTMTILKARLSIPHFFRIFETRSRAGKHRPAGRSGLSSLAKLPAAPGRNPAGPLFIRASL